MAPTGQKVLQSWRPESGLHRAWRPLMMAVATAVLVYGAQGLAAFLVVEAKHWAVTQVSAAILSVQLCNALAEWVDLGLATGWPLWVSVVLPPLGTLITGIASWALLRIVGHPWPVWVGTVVAACQWLQHLAKSFSSLATAYQCQGPDPTQQVGYTRSHC
jgi:hypothetical protein